MLFGGVPSKTYENYVIDKVSLKHSNAVQDHMYTKMAEVSIHSLPSLFYCMDNQLIARIQDACDNRSPVRFTASGSSNLIQDIQCVDASPSCEVKK